MFAIRADLDDQKDEEMAIDSRRGDVRGTRAACAALLIFVTAGSAARAQILTAEDAFYVSHDETLIVEAFGVLSQPPPHRSSRQQAA